MLREGERLEELGRGLQAVVSDAHTFGADALLLADFSRAAVRRPDAPLCDLGTGCGIIPLLWRRAGLFNPVEAFELRPEAADMARRAAALNGLSDMAVHTQDLRAIGPEFAGRFALVTCNPPYTPAGTGRPSRSPAARAARQETGCTLSDVIAAAARLLHGGGSLCLCLPPARLADLMGEMRRGGVEPKRMRLVQLDAGHAPWLTLVEGRRGGRPGLRMEPTLCMRDGQGNETAAMRQIYGKPFPIG